MNIQEIKRRRILDVLLKNAEEEGLFDLIKVAIKDYEIFNYDLGYYKEKVKKLERYKK